MQDGKPYPKVAHLAEDVFPFVAIGQRDCAKRALRRRKSIEADLDAGHPADRGSRHATAFSTRKESRLPSVIAKACACLAHLHALPRHAGYSGYAGPYPSHSGFRPHGDEDRNPAAASTGTCPGSAASRRPMPNAAEYLAIWDQPDRSSWHDRKRTCCCATSIRRTSSGAASDQGIDRIGIIDFQDAMIGPTAYDVASIIAGCARHDRAAICASDDGRLYYRARRAQGAFRRSDVPERLGIYVGAAQLQARRPLGAADAARRQARLHEAYAAHILLSRGRASNTKHSRPCAIGA